MAYFIHGLTSIDRWFPVFDFIDISDDFVEPYLGGGERITDDTIPSLHSIPKAARLESRHKSLPDVFKVRFTIAVNEKMKMLIENIEPNIHQFFKIDLFNKNMEVFEGNYYLLNIAQLIDAIIADESSIEVITKKNGARYGLGSLNRSDYRTLRKRDVAGKHLWRECLTKKDIFFSTDLHDAIVKNKINRIDYWLSASEK